MREPTKEEIAKFKRACKALDELGRAGFRLYLANSTLNLMVCDSHDHQGNQQQDGVRESVILHGAGGGDW